MAMNPFIGRSRDQLETDLARAQDDLAAGKTVSSINTGDFASGKQVQLTPQRRIEYILRALHAIDPDTYPASEISRVSRTQVRMPAGDTDY